MGKKIEQPQTESESTQYGQENAQVWRQSILNYHKSTPIRRVVVKIGSAGVSSAATGVNYEHLAKIVKDCQCLRSHGIETVIVSSGAIEVGRSIIGQRSEQNIEYLQACSAVGQPLLVSAWQSEFSKYKQTCAQVLLTHEDMGDSRRFLNLRNTMHELMGEGITPIVNENDSVSFEEITVGDNDQLAAMITAMVDASLLVILTSTDGLYKQAPDTPLSLEGQLREVSWEYDCLSLDTSGKTSAGRGGMAAKLGAIRKVTPLGIPVLLGSFLPDNPILRLFEDNGTIFSPKPQSQLELRRRWFLTTSKHAAKVVVDRGAASSLASRRSLLASGIISVEGSFKRGDSIQIWYENEHIATGLVEYDSEDVDKIQGVNSRQIEDILGYIHGESIIHRNNMVILKRLSS